MFTIFENHPLKDCKPEQESWRLTGTVAIPHSKPTLIASCSKPTGREESFHSYVFYSLEAYLDMYDDSQPPPLQLQLLIPRTPKQNGWAVHDIASIRTASLPIDDEESEEVRMQPVEEFITTTGECFTFKSLESGEFIKTPMDEIYRSV